MTGVALEALRQPRSPLVVALNRGVGMSRRLFGAGLLILVVAFASIPELSAGPFGRRPRPCPPAPCPAAVAVNSQPPLADNAPPRRADWVCFGGGPSRNMVNLGNSRIASKFDVRPVAEGGD